MKTEVEQDHMTITTNQISFNNSTVSVRRISSSSLEVRELLVTVVPRIGVTL